MPRSRAAMVRWRRRIEIFRIEPRQIELWLSVRRIVRTGPQPRMRRAVFDDALGLLVGPLGRFPSPQPEKIMMMCGQKIEIRVVVEFRRRIFAVGQSVAVVFKVMPVMRSREIDGFARPIGKITRIILQRAQRTGGRGSQGGSGKESPRQASEKDGTHGYSIRQAWRKFSRQVGRPALRDHGLRQLILQAYSRELRKSCIRSAECAVEHRGGPGRIG